MKPMHAMMLAHNTISMCTGALERGVGGSWNWFIEELDIPGGEILLGVDPDGRPVQKGWDRAIQDILTHDESCFTAQLNVAGTYALQMAREEFKIGDTWAIDYKDTTAWTMGAFDVKWLRGIGGFLQGHPQYGFCEIVMNNRIRPQGGRALIVRDFYDEHLKAEDQLYTNWKLACAQQRTQKSFGDWLKEQGNG